MISHLRANLWSLVLTVLLCSVLYPVALLGIGQTVFRDKAHGSLLTDEKGNIIGSRLIAQPFTGDEYFQPRPSAVSYNAAATGGSNWGANNPLLRQRVLRQLGPVAKYRSGPQQGQPVGPDIDDWLQKDRFQGKPGIVAQWAQAHETLARDWVKADLLHTELVAAWHNEHPVEVATWIKQNSGTPQPQPEDLAVPFFTSYSALHPGTFPCVVEQKSVNGKAQTHVEPVRNGSDIQSRFFDMWLQDHATVQLDLVPADMVMASGSGLDPHITLSNALWQLDRVAAAWASKTGTDEGQLRREIGAQLRDESRAPLGGLVGVPLVNVLDLNRALRERYRQSSSRFEQDVGAGKRHQLFSKHHQGF